MVLLHLMKKANTSSLAENTAKTLINSSGLCDSCLVRQGASQDFVRKYAIRATQCEICEGMLDQLPSLGKMISKSIKKFDFGTFLIGASIPQHILDREDELRSRLKLRGKEGIKSQITKFLNSQVAKSTKRKIDHTRPDLTILVSLPEAHVVITPRSIWLSARYRKTARGIPQRSTRCKVCNGLGCASCNYKGAPSQTVQSLVSDYLLKKYKGESCSFIWIGSEDERSLVNGEGRPFYVEIQKPIKRTVRGLQKKSIKLDDGVELSSLSVLPSRPTLIPQFSIKCMVYLTEAEVREDTTREFLGDEIESRFKDFPLRVKMSRRFRVVTRHVQSIKVLKNIEGHKYGLEIESDGGIPIKKFVSGEDDSVSPSLSPYIRGYGLDPMMPFDVLEITLAGPRGDPQQAQLSNKKKNLFRRSLHERYPRRTEEASESRSEESQLEVLAAAEDVTLN